MRKLKLYAFLMVILVGIGLVVYFNINVKVDNNGLRYDGIEDIPKYKVIMEKAGHEADNELMKKGYKKRMGYCHIYWRTKKRILRDKYHIIWRTPVELNPGVIFD
jgi:hypothetical protein